MYPITYNFKKIALANKVTAIDGSGKVVLYAHQKMFKLKEKILLFADIEKTTPVGELNADRVIDFSPVQTFTDSQGNAKLSVKRNGKKSIWKANYEIVDANNVSCFTVREDNAWVKVMDVLLREVPILGFFSGYFFNPKYNIFDSQGQVVGQIVKEPSFLESNYKLSLDQPQVDSQGLLPVATMTIITRERTRG
jgi:hypothetical protein